MNGYADYLLKPFSLLELEIRLKALLRRARVNDGRRRASRG
ncbi:hypothetical protein [Janthinobacterium sp. 61]|nr:hypothetical protein [Janthinobacterium sp. 61]